MSEARQRRRRPTAGPVPAVRVPSLNVEWQWKSTRRGAHGAGTLLLAACSGPDTPARGAGAGAVWSPRRLRGFLAPRVISETTTSTMKLSGIDTMPGLLKRTGSQRVDAVELTGRRQDDEQQRDTMPVKIDADALAVVL